jgi:hypothetical protein
MGLGAETFVSFDTLTIKGYIGHSLVGDIDGDGQGDLVLHIHKDDYHIKVEDRKQQLAWLQWPGLKKYDIAFGDFTGDRLSLHDMNGDGHLDVISGKINENGKTQIFWYENLSSDDKLNSISWKEHLVGNFEGYIKDILTDDINGDSSIDIVARSHSFTQIFFQKKKSWMVKKITHPKKEGLDIADLDMDGDLDIILNGFWMETPDDPMKDDYNFYDIDNKWYTQKTGSWQDNCSYVATADINQDGLLDIILSQSEIEGYPLSWYSVDSKDQIKTGPWKEHKITEVFDWCETVDIGDIDHDGDLDVLAAKFKRHNKPDQKYYNSPPYPVSIFYNQSGDGSQWERQDLNQEGIYAGVLGDIGGDGDLDVVGPLSYWTGPIKIWENKASDNKLSLNDWTYIEVDNKRDKWGDYSEPSWLKYFGLDMKDVTGDGFNAILAGRHIYHNPGGSMTDVWEKIDLGFNVDGLLFVDVDGDAFIDVIGQALPDVYWIEAEDKQCKSWKSRKIAQLPVTGHVNGQGYELGQLVPGGKPEILLTCEDGVHYLIIPDDPVKGKWPNIHIAHETMDEGIGVGDIDGDGDLDIATGKRIEGAERGVCWYENPGNGKEDWQEHLVITTNFAPDRIRIADINQDGLSDIVVSEERYPGLKPDASLYWIEQHRERRRVYWIRHTIITQYSMNNLDVADMDRDGDLDIVTCEHKGPYKRLQIFSNNGQGRFTEHILDKGKESHLGTQVIDMDTDGDPDIVSIGWDAYEYLHLWKNCAMDLSHIKRIKWKHITSQKTFKVPMANVGRQASALVGDLDQDGSEDIIVAGWNHPSMVWLRKTEKGWDRYLVDNRHSHVEAGGYVYDIDGDGDLDILQGGSWASNEVWWWENPYPGFNPEKAWKRYIIKDYGANQHHDQIIGDFDHDGKGELVLWNQRAQKLLMADIPKNPKKKNWKFIEIWSWPKAYKYEGFDKADIDLDGQIDLIGGGYWFKHEGNKKFKANMIDDYGMSRSIAGDFIEGGRPEIVLGSGDGVAPLNLYEWKNGEWLKTSLFDVMDHGHTLQAGDINGDGHLDIYAAEMFNPGPGDQCKQYILYGNGKGDFHIEVLSIGIGTHEGRIGDLDGDGDLDILQKDFQEQRRIDIWLNEGE